MRTLVLLGVATCAVFPIGAAESIGGQQAARAARSVHLHWAAASPEVEAFYLEVTVEQSTAGSYFMACGWSGGYFGIQQINPVKTVAIFSVWDPTKGDDPKLVKVEDRVELLQEGDGVRIRRFGGEGTGGQCMTDFPWAAGETHRFLVRAEAHGAKTAFSGWLFEPRQQTWRHLVTFRTRTGGKLLRQLYSFVEDFRRDGHSPDDVRRARFANGWVRPAGGEWQPLTRARFTASRADWEARDTIDAGVNEQGFFLVTGGDTRRQYELNTTLEAATPPKSAPKDLPAAVWATSSDAKPK